MQEGCEADRSRFANVTFIYADIFLFFTAPFGDEMKIKYEEQMETEILTKVKRNKAFSTLPGKL